MGTRWAIMLSIVLLISLFVSNVAVAQAVARYFPETGHWVRGDFLRAYESVPDPLLVYGFPITEAIQTESVPQNPGMLVQYFHKVRFEYHPENPPGQEIVISPLGEYLYQTDGPGKVVPVYPLLANCRNIPADGFPVCYDFLSFFDANGGVDQFGYPISGIEYQGGRMVQHFQLARFEWHPELPAGPRVTLTDLGRRYFDLIETPILRLPAFEDYQTNLISINAHAFMNKAVSAPDDALTLYVIVQDQNLYPVANAQVSVVIRFSDGDEIRYLMDLTNEHGVTKLTFDFQDASYGFAEVEVTVSSSLLQTQTQTTFRIW